jgi:hypothetical protein
MRRFMRSILLAAILLCAAPALARDSRLPLQTGLQEVERPARWGVGFMLGDPFGITVKRYLGGVNAFDAYLAFAYGPGVRFGGDWLWNLGRIAHAPKLDIDVYVGVGPFIGTFQGACGPFLVGNCNGDTYLGGRVPIGAEMLLKEVPVTFGVEVAPGIAFAPGRWGALLDFVLQIRLLL